VQRFGGIEPNPTYETLMNAVEQVRREKLDFLLAVGGGSVIDGTKFVAAAVDYAGEPWDILETTASTSPRAADGLRADAARHRLGDELRSRGHAQVDAGQARLRQPAGVPRFSVLDPVKTYTLPPRQIANGAVDAFVHVDGAVPDLPGQRAGAGPLRRKPAADPDRSRARRRWPRPKTTTCAPT
jgi:NADP-dependent alcohol dehydrogenase